MEVINEICKENAISRGDKRIDRSNCEQNVILGTKQPEH